jgi:hypothetical protein
MAKRFELHGGPKPTAMATVAERRFGDSEALCRTGDNARANGAVYLAGFVIEILLKAKLVAAFPPTARKRQRDVAAWEQDIWNLIWRRHDLGKMLGMLRDLEAVLVKQGERDGVNYVAELKKVDAEWSVLVRYSTRTMLMEEARQLLERVRILKEVLK